MGAVAAAVGEAGRVGALVGVSGALRGSVAEEGEDPSVDGVVAGSALGTVGEGWAGG